MRISKTFKIEQPETIKQKLLYWGVGDDFCVLLDSNQYQQPYSSYEAILAVGANTIFSGDFKEAFNKLRNFRKEVNDFIIGYLGYDLKNDIENLVSDNYDGLNFPDIFFFQPKKLIFLSKEQIEFQYLTVHDIDITHDFNSILQTVIPSFSLDEQIKIKLRIHKDSYLQKVESMLAHIHRGDIYEANFCQEFYSEGVELDAVHAYFSLNDISKTPFASFLKVKDKFVISASPERYLKKIGEKVISQPIKGTAPRSANENEDIQLQMNLKTNPKELSENIMIVDLVRNDLAHTAIKGTVQVEELCEVYSFKQVHQLISTVTSKVPNTIDPIDIIESTFPMGSMTGAPKISAMKIIEELEETKRGVYSGAIGYIKADGDLDFNVVIRSILYNKNNKYLSFSVGSAITAASDPFKEYEECLVKAKAMRAILEK
ncbi:anthranilate synthase component I family protein [Aegicerativicinus sediminis]